MTVTMLTAREALADIRVVDADSHVSEWADLWTSRAPASLRHRVPQRKLVDNVPTWVIDGDKPLGVFGAMSAIHGSGLKSHGMEFGDWQLEDVHAACYDVKARVEYLNQEGIWAQIAYPNALGFGGQKAALVDGNLRLASTEIFNDAMAEMQSDSGGRIYPMALLPWWDVKLSVTEARRCHAMGLRGVNINPDPHGHGLPDLSDHYWDPLWETCTELDLPINFHIGASDESASWYGVGAWPCNRTGASQLAYGSLMLFVSNMRVIANILMSCMLERFPTLKVVSVESGAGWVPFLLEAIEYEMMECRVPFKVPPTDIFKRQMYACSWFERRDFANSVRNVGIDNVMFETDFPHPTCLYPNGLDYLTCALNDMTLDERRRVFGGTAARVYNLKAT